MAPKVTSSSNRNKRGSKKPVTKGQNPQRANRQTASNATVSQSGGSRGSGARVTNASQRTTSGSARVTGGARPALPPGRSGGALATRPPTQSTRQANARAQLRDASRGSTGPNRVGQPAGSANRMYGANVVNNSVNRAVAATRLANLGKLAKRAAVPLAIGSQLADIKGGFERMAKSPFIQKMGKGGKPAPSAGRRTNPKAAKPAKPKPQRQLPKPTPKPTVTKAAAPSPRKVAPTPAKPKPKAPAKAKPPAASKPTVAQTSGIGPVKSGAAYASKKGSISESVRQLREMRAASVRRQTGQAAPALSSSKDYSSKFKDMKGGSSRFVAELKKKKKGYKLF
jgi:hypothetical protein